MADNSLNTIDVKSVKIELNECAKFCIETLEVGGFEAWVVGGCVRDAILKRDVVDIDITTNATPDEMKDLFINTSARVFETGIKHGTLTIFLNGQTCEVTTYRSDGMYVDSRHPENVTFVRSIEEDLARRDFTINAICYNPTKGIYDPYTGINDIRDKTIRSIGDAKKRFEEDALRMLRAARFVSQLGFQIEHDTYRAIQKTKAKLLFVSSERITSEIDRILSGKYVLDCLLKCADIIEVAIPEITACRGFDQHTKYHAYDVWGHIAHVVHHVSNTPLLRWTALFHDIGKPSTFFIDDGGQGHFYGHADQGARIVNLALKRFTLSEKTKRSIEMLVLRHNDTLSPSEKSIRKTISLMNGDVCLFRNLLALKRADSLGHAPNYTAQKTVYDEIENLLDTMLEEGIVFSRGELAISGDDLIAQGVNEGKKIGELLDQALHGVQIRETKNSKDELLDYIARFI